MFLVGDILWKFCVYRWWYFSRNLCDYGWWDYYLYLWLYTIYNVCCWLAELFQVPLCCSRFEVSFRNLSVLFKVVEVSFRNLSGKGWPYWFNGQWCLYFTVQISGLFYVCNWWYFLVSRVNFWIMLCLFIFVSYVNFQITCMLCLFISFRARVMFVDIYLFPVLISRIGSLNVTQEKRWMRSQFVRVGAISNIFILEKVGTLIFREQLTKFNTGLL